MSVLPCAGVLGLLALVSGCSSRMGVAEARLANAQPCFGLAPEETREGDKLLNHLVVYDATVLPPAEVWAVTARGPDRSVRLNETQCVRYGEAPPDYRASSPPPLRPGTVYEITISGPREGAKRSESHSGRFCVAEPLANGAGYRRIVKLAPNASSCALP